MLDSIESASNECTDFVLLGDLNYNYVIAESVSSNPVNHIEQLFACRQLLDISTRVTQNSATLLDVILRGILIRLVLLNMVSATIILCLL